MGVSGYVYLYGSQAPSDINLHLCGVCPYSLQLSSPPASYAVRVLFHRFDYFYCIKHPIYLFNIATLSKTGEGENLDQIIIIDIISLRNRFLLNDAERLHKSIRTLRAS